MLSVGVIGRSDSDYCSLAVLLRKKDGSARFCTDYKRLNLLTKNKVAPLPQVHKSLKKFGEAVIFSALDLKSAYWQIFMNPTLNHLTAFATLDGATYQFKVMPFGRKNATWTATFQKMCSNRISKRICPSLPGRHHNLFQKRK